MSPTQISSAPIGSSSNVETLPAVSVSPVESSPPVLYPFTNSQANYGHNVGLGAMPFKLPQPHNAIVISVPDGDHKEIVEFSGSVQEINFHQNDFFVGYDVAIKPGLGFDSLEGEVKKKMENLEEQMRRVKRTLAADQGSWIKHYCSLHRILVVGDGDFSFSACLAVAFQSASNMIATSLDSHGFFKELSREEQLQRHRELVRLFLENAKWMVSKNGEIHITHKANAFHNEWNLESIASLHGLRLIEAVTFNRLEYPGYQTKRGFGGNNDFNCYPSKTHKFGLKPSCVSYYSS